MGRDLLWAERTGDRRQSANFGRSFRNSTDSKPDIGGWPSTG